MIRRRTAARPRRGVAAVEMAIVSIVFMVPMMIGIWEVGRLVQVQQIVSNSAREGARLAAQGVTLKDNGDGTYTQVNVTLNSSSPSVQSVAYQYLLSSGLTQLDPSDVQVTFQFLAPKSDGSTPTDPYLGEKNEPFMVTVTILQSGWNKVRWVNLGIVNPTQVTYSVTWQMLVDDTFTVNTSLPTW